MKSYLDAADAFLAKCFGITGEKVTPEILKVSGKRISILTTDSNKRHSHTKDMDDFMGSDFKKLNTTDRKKLGLALGKAIAEDLVITFEPFSLKK